jgi:type 1 fimbria pilin
MMISYFHIVFDALTRIYPTAGAAMRSLAGRQIVALVAASAAAAIPLQASANCTKVSANIYADNVSGSSGGLPAVVTLNKSEFQPDGTLMASGIGSFLRLGFRPYQPEEILFRCNAADEGKLFEFYSTNGDNPVAGKEEDGNKFGLPGAYRTPFNGMLLRVTHVRTGEAFSRYWKSRPMTGLDRDTTNPDVARRQDILVKAKDFSDVKTELLRASNNYGTTVTGLYRMAEPVAYIAFKGPGLASDGLKVGADHAAGNWQGWPGEWPGVVSLYNRVSVQRVATCSVTTVTPNVVFPTITVAQLNQGVDRRVPFDIRFACDTTTIAGAFQQPFVSGTGKDQTAMGVLVPDANYQSAVAEGQLTSAGGVSFLLSTGYGTDPSIATGVGIALSGDRGEPMNFLSNQLVTGGNKAAGWYPVLDGASRAGAKDADGNVPYLKTLVATLKKLPGKTVTPGKVRAQAQVIIRVQ